MDNPEHEATRNCQRGLKTNITSLYRGETWKEICILEILRIKIERRTADLQFLIPRSKDYSLNKLSFIFYLVPMMDPLWGLKRQLNEHQTVDNLDHTTAKNYHRSLKSNITSLYGGETRKEICLLEILRIKIEKGTADLQLPEAETCWL